MRAERSYAAYEKAAVAAEARVAKAQADGLKASVQAALQKEALRAREAAEVARAAAKIVEAEERKAKVQAQVAKAHTSHAETFIRGMTAMALAAGTAGIAITAALVKVSHAFETLYFTSQRTGASVSNIKSLQYAFTQVGSTGTSAVGAIESFARAMRTNPGIGGFVRSLGVATQEGGKARDTLDVLSDAVDKISAKHPYYTGAQMAELLGLDESQFETFNRYRKEIKEYRAEYEASLKAVGLNSAKAAEQSEHFQQALRRIGMQVTVAGQSLLVSLLPVLERLASTVSRFMTENAPALNGFFTKVGEIAQSAATGLEGFIKGFSGEEGARRIQAWADAMNNLADGMRGVWRVIAWIQDSMFWKALTYFESPLWKFLKYAGGSAVGSAQASTGGGGSGPVEDTRNAWQRNAPKWLGGKDAPGVGSDGGRSIKPTSKGIDPTVEAYIRKAAIARGINPDTAVGVADGEGLGGSTPDRLTPGDFKNGKPTSFGPFQLHRGGPGSVGTEYEKATGHSADDPAHWQEQIDFALSWAKKNGWNAWYGRSKHNIGTREGLNYDPSAASGSSKQVGGNVAPVNGVGGLDQNQGGATRSQPVTEALRNQIVAAAKAAGVNAEVFSGGQDESGPDRVGSHRHDHGRSADLKLYTTGADGKRRYLNMTNDADRGVMESFIRESVKAGANGVGAAVDYMGPNSIHIGGGSPSAWGAGGSSANVPDWVARAHRDGMRQRGRVTAADMMAAKPPIVTPSLPNLAMTPGGYDVNKIAGQPMGASSITTTTNNAGATVTMQPTTHVTIQGGDPASNAAQFERAAGRVNDRALRNVQTAIR